jgi:thymidylate synthase ThyX
MHPYVAEDFTDAEVAVLRRYFTNLEGPVFALVNLPEVVKGALFARYSRSSKSLRRLFLDEFVGDLELAGDAGIDATVGLERADDLYQKIFFEYGDDSVAQLGGVHLACEQASNLLTKVLERGRLMSYLEQSTRYLGYDRRLANGLYRFYRDNDLLESRFGARYIGEMDRMFDTYRELLPVLTDWLTLKYPKTPEDTDFVYRQAIRAKALDGLRGLLPASALSNLGIYASGQAYESLLLRMRAHPLPEVREYAQLMLDGGSPGLAIWQTLAAPREPSLPTTSWTTLRTKRAFDSWLLIPKVSREFSKRSSLQTPPVHTTTRFDAWAV